MIFFVFLLPALAHARISIGIDLSSRENDVKFNLRGELVRNLTGVEAEKFGLKFYTQIFPLSTWQCTDDINLVEVLKPIKATVISFSSKPIALVHHRYNNTGEETVQYRADLQRSVTNTVTNSWHGAHTIQVGTEISTEINFVVGKVGGKSSFSYNHQWGQSRSNSQSVTVGSSAGLTIPTPPRTTIEATMLATQGTTEFEVVYEASIHGACGDKRIDWDPFEIFKKLGMGGKVPDAVPRVRQVIEKFKVDFYCDFEAVSSSTRSNNTILPLDCRVIARIF